MFDFLWKDIICQYQYFQKLVINKRLENKKVVKLIQRYRIKKIIVLVYHFQVNEMIKYKYKLIINALLKMSDSSSTN